MVKCGVRARVTAALKWPSVDHAIGVHTPHRSTVGHVKYKKKAKKKKAFVACAVGPLLLSDPLNLAVLEHGFDDRARGERDLSLAMPSNEG